MAKLYDFDKAFNIVAEKREQLQGASLGMQEDWGWTNESILNMTDKPQTIAGIGGSAWATPVLKLEYKDGSSEIIDCYTSTTTTVSANEVAAMKSFAKATGGMDSVN